MKSPLLHSCELTILTITDNTLEINYGYLLIFVVVDIFHTPCIRVFHCKSDEIKNSFMNFSFLLLGINF